MRELILVIMLSAPLALPRRAPKYQWQHEDTSCNKLMTFCWYGAEEVSDPQVTAYGNRWVSQDKQEKPFEWITQVRCIKELHLCILARNQKVLNGSQTNTDLLE
jgi:hypothetical protein